MKETDITVRTVIANPQCDNQFISVIHDCGSSHALIHNGKNYFPISMARVFRVLMDNLEFIRDGDDPFEYTPIPGPLEIT